MKQKTSATRLCVFRRVTLRPHRGSVAPYLELSGSRTPLRSVRDFTSRAVTKPTER